MSLPINEWGPDCARCGKDEFRIDGYCSIYCRDMAEAERLQGKLPKMSDEEKRAYDWALEQKFPSVSARYARLLAFYIKRIIDKLEAGEN